jgi:D-arabinonate dehydratase
MKITELKVRRYAQRPGGEIQTVTLETDEGVSGLGFVAAVDTRGASRSGELIAGLLRTALRDLVLGQDPVLTDALWQRMVEGVAGRRGARGLPLHCIAAVDFACWDIKGKLAGRPVSDLLGQRRKIASYANAAHLVAPAELARTAAAYVARGHKALKIRGGLNAGTTREATARVQAVREAVGPDVKLMVDANGTWDAATAIEQLRAWERYDLYWLEEPCAPDDIGGYVKVRARAGNVYIAGGEQHSGVIEFRALLDSEAVDIVQPAASQVGGITEWLRVYHLASARGVPVSPWNLQSVHAHMAAGLANVKWIEYFMPDNSLLDFQNRLFAEPALREERTDEGVFLLPPEKPGLGLALDEEVAARHLIAES